MTPTIVQMEATRNHAVRDISGCLCFSLLLSTFLDETCRSDEFTCGNGKCIQKHWVCDLDNDCDDNSDEKDCPPIHCSPDTQFQCSETYCITKRWQCDGDEDCADGRDEKDCPVTPSKSSICMPDEFECGDHITCIHVDWLCDGAKECPDGSDESPTRCKNITCRSDQFQCKDKTCISGHYHCSGNAECKDGSDELNCGKKLFQCN